MRLPAFILILLCASMLACAGVSSYTADMSDDVANPQTMMVATPLSVPLYIVVKDAQFPKEIKIEDSKHSVANFQPFFEKSLTKMFTPYFKSVTLVKDTQSIPTHINYYHGEVEFKGFKSSNMVAGGMTYSILSMPMSFALRPSGAEDYLFSYTGIGKSELSYNTLDLGIKQTTESAINGLLSGWTEKKVHQTLRGMEKSLQAPKEPEAKITASLSSSK